MDVKMKNPFAWIKNFNSFPLALATTYVCMLISKLCITIAFLIGLTHFTAKMFLSKTCLKIFFLVFLQE